MCRKIGKSLFWYLFYFVLKSYKLFSILLYVWFFTVVVLLLYHYLYDLDFLFNSVRELFSWFWWNTATFQAARTYEQLEMWQISFISESVGKNTAIVYPASDYVVATTGDLLVFFVKVYNSNEFVLTGISTSYVFPEEAASSIVKVMCFCYNEYVVFKDEILDFPIVYRLLGVNESVSLKTNLRQIGINYTFYKVGLG